MIEANSLGVLGLLVVDAMGAALGDLSPSGAALLLTLHYRPAVTATELARVAGIAQPTATRVLDGLVRRGLIARGASAGRVTPLRLTAQGRARAKALQSARLAVLDKLLQPLAPAERMAFIAAADKLMAAATTSRRFARTVCRLCDHQMCDAQRCPIGAAASELERQGAASC